MIQYRLIKDPSNNTYTIHDIASNCSGDDWYKDILEALHCDTTTVVSEYMYSEECKEIAAGTLQVILEFPELPSREQFQQQYPELLI